MKQEYWIEEGCFISEWSNTEEDPDCSIAQARVCPGQRTEWHRLHHVVERYAILKGEGSMELGDQAARTMRPGDVVVIPAGVRQRIANTGNEDLVFLAICTPRFRPDCYERI